MSSSSAGKQDRFKIPFFVLLSILVILIIGVVYIAVVNGGDDDPARVADDDPVRVTEVEIIEVLFGNDLHGNWYFSRSGDGRTCTVEVTANTKIYDGEGKPVMSSGLREGMRLRVTHSSQISLESTYKEDGTLISPILRGCTEIHIIEQDPPAAE